MKNEGVFFPLVLATLAGSCVITFMSGDFGHWIPIVLALVVVGGIASADGR
jgi:uncharacterized membrane protein YjjB (DUF3815 family)